MVIYKSKKAAITAAICTGKWHREHTIVIPTYPQWQAGRLDAPV